MMTVQASKSVTAVDKIDPGCTDLRSRRVPAERRTGRNHRAARASSARACSQAARRAYDREARFPTENYRDLHRSGLLGIAIPRKHGGLGADYQTYALAAAEIGRYCGATALTWNMHVCSTLWSGPLADDLDMDAATRAEHERRRAVHYKRIVEDGAIYSQPFSEGGAAAAGGVAFGTEAKPVDGGWLVNGKKIFASLSGHADYYGVLCTEDRGRRESLTAQHALSGGAGQGRRRVRGRRLGSAGHARHGVAHAAVQGRVRAGGRGADAARRLFPGGDALAAYVPDAVADLYRPRAGGLRFHRALSARRGAGHAAGASAGCIRPSRSRWRRCRSSSSRPRRSGSRRSPRPASIRRKEQVLRAYAAQYSAMEGANELATLAIRTCGGQSMLKSLPLERIYRDSRCGSLMLPWTAELCLDRIGRDALYETGETDD